MAIKGLNDLSRRSVTSKRSCSITGDNAKISFNPNNPQNVELAIQPMQTAINERVGSYGGNDMVGVFADQIKGSYRKAILGRAAAGRSGKRLLIAI